MLCHNCGKNEATVKYTQIINGNKAELVFCEGCSKELGINPTEFNMPIDFSSFFGGMLGDVDAQEFFPMITKTEELKCQFCNMTYDELVNNGKFGCANCYNVFSDKIDSILKRIHGDNKYLGRKGKMSQITNGMNENNVDSVGGDAHINPGNCGQVPLQNLHEQLKLAIKEERYEDAAVIRDKINNL